MPTKSAPERIEIDVPLSQFCVESFAQFFFYALVKTGISISQNKLSAAISSEHEIDKAGEQDGVEDVQFDLKMPVFRLSGTSFFQIHFATIEDTDALHSVHAPTRFRTISLSCRHQH